MVSLEYSVKDISLHDMPMVYNAEMIYDLATKRRHYDI